MKILLADDHLIVRDGLKHILNQNFPDSELIEAGNHGEIIDSVLKNNPDLVILDISLPGRSGLETLQYLKELKPKLPVLILSMHPEDQFAARVIKAGASGYINKENSSTELIEAVRRIMKGDKFITGKVAEALADFINHPSSGSDYQRLSDRELQVLRMIGSGMTVSDIARDLSLSVKTISTYRTHILAKLGLKNTSGIIAYAIKNNLVS